MKHFPDDQIFDFADNKSDNEQTKNIEDHSVSCLDCRKEILAAQMTVVSLKKDSLLKTSNLFTYQVLSKLNLVQPLNEKNYLFKFIFSSFITALIAVVIFFFSLVSGKTTKPGLIDKTIDDFIRISTNYFSSLLVRREVEVIWIISVVIFSLWTFDLLYRKFSYKKN